MEPPSSQAPMCSTAMSKPVKCVKGPADLAKWRKSMSYHHYMRYITLLCNSVRGGKTRKSVAAPAAGTPLDGLLRLLDACRSATDIHPPIEQAQRFGNAAFRQWHQWLQEVSALHLCIATAAQNVDTLLEPVVRAQPSAHIELREYLFDAFGNATRIDYGTGHEAAFMMTLCCLHQLRITTELDLPAVVCYVFDSYSCVCRHLQRTYHMEPAGSQGVWSLDDFAFMPFLLGSAQMMMCPVPQLDTPHSFVNETVVNEFADEYLFLAAVRYIMQTKTGPFAEHSNQLWNISGVPNWSKVNQGLVKMYDAEVLNKFPVVQHFLFGSLMSFNEHQS